MPNSVLEYAAPLEDMAFLLHDVSDNKNANALVNDSSKQDLLFILQQAARFAEQELAPINTLCDTQGCQFENGEVRLPPKLKAALENYSQAGWTGLCMPEKWGGQAQSATLGSLVAELLTAANHAFSMTPALTMSACRALIAYGSDFLKDQFLTKLVTGQYTGTMCLTEAHCGSDLGLIRSSASANADGTYQVKGNKIFVSAGSHDASDNIIHLVLARLNGSPAGIKGLSLFLVPEKQVNQDGQLQSDNGVYCIGIEEKMGVHGNPTCSINFENSQGYLIGELDKGINAMFAMMNEMRLGTSIQGIGLSERSFQKSVKYALSRTQMRSLSGIKNPELEADPLVVHPDIRRMLLTQKVFAQGGRALVQFCSELLDQTQQDPSDKEALMLLDMLTPIAKGFCTESGLESASHAIQIHGGHGFIKDTGVEQLYRDGRIATLYEGTTGIQALDLLGRKILGSQGQSLMLFTKMMHRLCKQSSDNHALTKLLDPLQHYCTEWPEITMEIGKKSMQNPDEVGAASFDYLMYSGYVVHAYFWVKMALTAQGLLDGQKQSNADKRSQSFLQNKITCAQFYFERILPRAQSHKAAMLSGHNNLAAIFDQ